MWNEKCRVQFGSCRQREGGDDGWVMVTEEMDMTEEVDVKDGAVVDDVVEEEDGRWWR